MRKPKQQLYILCDLEGASQISPDNRQAMHHGSELWQKDGRRFITSDVLAVCEAAAEFGIDEIVLNDEHDSGMREPNVLPAQLPKIVHILKRPHMPGTQKNKVNKNAFGMIIVGQHAMYNGGGFAPHTIQSPPIAQVTLNGRVMGEIGLEMALFPGMKLLAVFGEEAAIREAQDLCPGVVGGAVKSLERNWFPPIEETHVMIRQKTLEALRARESAKILTIKPPYRFSLRLVEGWQFNLHSKEFIPWIIRFFFTKVFRGKFVEGEAFWETKNIDLGINIIYMLKMGACKIK